MNDLNQKLTEAIDALIPEAGLKECHPGDRLQVDCQWHEPELRHVLWALYEREYGDEGEYIHYIIDEMDMSKSLYSQDDSVKEWLLNLLTDSK